MKLYFNIVSAIMLSFHFSFLFSQTNHRDSVDILTYSIRLDLSKTETKQIYGSTELKLCLLFPGKVIDLDFEGLITDSIISNNQKLDFTYQASILRIKLKNELKITDTATMSVYYHGSPIKDKIWGGFFMDKDYAFNYGIGMQAIPPNFGRIWFPCIDNFTDRAFYEYMIKVKSNHVAACPGILQSVINQNDGTKIYHWKLHQNIPTYLSSVAVADYSVIKDSVQGIERFIPIELYVNRGQEKTALKTFANLKDFIHSFEKRFGPYKWDKVGYAGTMFNGGAMEHASNISYSANCNNTTDCESTLVHELSHHWFGDLVTCSSEKDMWLNEGWARYCEAIYYEYKGGELAYKKQIRENHNQVLYDAVNNPESFGSIYGMPHSDTYGSVVYDKGGDVAHTLRGQLGDSLFFSALKNYFIQFAFNHISVKEFQKFLTLQTNTDLNDFFDFWVYSSGFPHFSINSYKITKQKNKYLVEFRINQESLNTNLLLKSTWIEIGILDKNMKLNKYRIKQSGKSQNHKLWIDSEPALLLTDPDEKVGDAVTDEYMTLNQTGDYLFQTENFGLTLIQSNNPVFFQVSYHWISPEIPSGLKNIYKINNRYWEIIFYSIDKISSNGRFYCELNNDFYRHLGTSDKSKICLLYRENCQSAWQLLDSKSEIQGNILLFSFNGIKNGQYAVGLRE